MPFDTLHLSNALAVTAPDGAMVQVLLGLSGGSMAVFTLQPGQCSAAVSHRSVEELWFVLSGQGEMWRRDATRESVLPLEAGLCLSIPLGTTFQFRCIGSEVFSAVAVTLPPWPGGNEAVLEAGRWDATPCADVPPG